MFFAVIWILNTFGTLSIDALIFQLKVPLKGTNTDFYISFLIQVILPTLFILLIIGLIFKTIIYKNKKFTLHLPRFLINIIIMVIPVIIIVFSFYKLSNSIGLIDYIKNLSNTSDFIGENYIEPRQVEINFPEEKRNLIYIFMESMENTFMSYEVGGAMEENLIPELTAIADNNISFSNTNSNGGPITTPGTYWTIAAMVSQHMGLPLSLPIDNNSYNLYETFIPGGYSLGDILQANGYNQTLLVGSNAEYGGRKAFYQQHGNYKILDLFSAWADGIVPNNRSVFWGFEDLYLYEYAKKELENLSAQNEPFNLTMLTVDTHHVEGYYCSLCQNEHDKQYWNVISCASRQLQEFLSWVQQQDFYENTTIVIVGDHCSMATLVKDSIDPSYVRTTYNVFINSAISTENTKNRIFSTMDLFPKTLASLGANINGNRLSLGTNLFSDTPTLLEQYGIEYVMNGLNSRSNKYNSLLWGK